MKMNKKEIENVGAGILMPQLANRWRLNITSKVPLIEEMKDKLKMQIVAVSFDYHRQTLEMEIEQNVHDAHLHMLIKQLSKLSKINAYDNVCFTIEQLDGNEEITGRLLFNGCYMLEHNYTLDYSSSEAAKHTVKFSFKETNQLM